MYFIVQANEVLTGATTDSSSKISTMFAAPQDIGARVPPVVIEHDRFTCSWVEWKRHFQGLYAHSDESVLVVLIATEAGILILNPSSGNASFIGEMIAIPWTRIRSFGNTKSSFNMIARQESGEEVPFHFATQRADIINNKAVELIKHPSGALFPLKWPPLRFKDHSHPEKNILGLNK